MPTPDLYMIGAYHTLVVNKEVLSELKTMDKKIII
jgi:hypothetical protein